MSPVLCSREGLVDKIVRKIHELGQYGVQFATFPETVVPYYPYFSFVQPPVQNIAGAEQRKLLDQAVTVPSPATDAISEAYKEAGIAVSIGINELMKGELQAIREGTCALSCSAADSAAWRPCDTSRWSCGGAQVSRSLS